MNPISINTSLKQHAILGFLVGLWLVLFQIMISPFDVADLSLKNKLILIPPYGLILMSGYILSILLQNLVYKNTGSWGPWKEISFYIFLYALLLVLCHFYYKSDWINGTYSFSEFTLTVYTPIFIIFLAFIIVGRMYLNKLHNRREAKKTILRGSNKDDVLQLNPDDIVCISSAQNYVEVSYLLNGKLAKTLLRTTMKTMTDNNRHLIRVHRTYLVNPGHFIKWIDNRTALFNEIKVPVSKQYKDELKEALSVRN